MNEQATILLSSIDEWERKQNECYKRVLASLDAALEVLNQLNK